MITLGDLKKIDLPDDTPIVIKNEWDEYFAVTETKIQNMIETNKGSTEFYFTEKGKQVLELR